MGCGIPAFEKGFSSPGCCRGTGLLSRAIAPHVQEVYAIDITPEMLAHAREETAKTKIGNIFFDQGNAESLPYASACFDLVVSRLTIHHFENPAVQLQEMVRVCKPRHRVAVVDLLAPEDERIAKTYNDLERLRDPSHTWALSEEQMSKLMAGAGIAIEKVEVSDVEVDFQRWVQMTGTNPEIIAAIREELLNDIGDHSRTGMRPFMRNGELKFLQVWSITLGQIS